MNHTAIANALCGRYVKLTDRSAYIQSSLSFPDDGTMIGAYVIDDGAGALRITDDGDIAFHAAVAGADITRPRAKRYQAIAEAHGIDVAGEGVMQTICNEDELPYRLASFLQAASEIASLSVKHRPRDQDRFERIVGVALVNQYNERLTRRPEIVGISGHQLRFPFALDFLSSRPMLIQTIPAEEDRLMWKNVYETGGKFKDVLGARSDLRLVAVLEPAIGIDRARRYFADTADVIVYGGGDLALAA